MKTGSTGVAVYKLPSATANQQALYQNLQFFFSFNRDSEYQDDCVKGAVRKEAILFGDRPQNLIQSLYLHKHNPQGTRTHKIA